MRGKRLRMAGAGVLMAAALGACGGDDDSVSAEPAGTPSAPAAPDPGSAGATVPTLDYLDDVCLALGEFGTAFESSQDELDGAEKASSVEEGKRALTEFASASSDDAGQLLDAIEAAGAPDIADGDEVAADALAAFGGVAEGMAGLQPKIDAIDTDLAGLPAEVGKIVEAAGAAAFQVLAGFEVLEKAKLGELSETLPSCAEI